MVQPPGGWGTNATRKTLRNSRAGRSRCRRWDAHLGVKDGPVRKLRTRRILLSYVSWSVSVTLFSLYLDEHGANSSIATAPCC